MRHSLWCLLVLLGLSGCSSAAEDATAGHEYADAGAEGTVSPNCTPRTCTQLQADCGMAPDGCGGAIDCGKCPSTTTCGGGGPNRCGGEPCTPSTCDALGAKCGAVSDLCSGILQCGQCGVGLVCDPSHHCVEDQPNADAGACGSSHVDCNGVEADGCETEIGTLALVDRGGITTGASAYGCCDGNRCSCNAIDGDPGTKWGSWECSEGHDLCSLWFDFPAAVKLARAVVHQGGVPQAMQVSFGDAIAYDGAGAAVLDARASRAQQVTRATLHETQFPGGGLWWEVSEVEFYRCP